MTNHLKISRAIFCSGCSTCLANMNVLLLASLLTMTPPRYLGEHRLSGSAHTHAASSIKARTYHFAREPGGGSIHRATHVTLPTSLPTTANTWHTVTRHGVSFHPGAAVAAAHVFFAALEGGADAGLEGQCGSGAL